MTSSAMIAIPVTRLDVAVVCEVVTHAGGCGGQPSSEDTEKCCGHPLPSRFPLPSRRTFQCPRERLFKVVLGKVEQILLRCVLSMLNTFCDTNV